MLSITDLKVGTSITLDGQPYIVTAYQQSKQARGGSVVNTKLKNLITGKSLPKTFQGNDKIEAADIGFTRAQYLYNDGSDYHFMDGESYEQFSLSKEELGDTTQYLVDGTDVDIQNYDGKPIGVKLPVKMVLEVTETIPGVKGNTADGGSKPATLETGLVVNVPLFIKEGEKIRVNTDTGEYVERA
jgi:elongation factor P